MNTHTMVNNATVTGVEPGRWMSPSNPAAVTKSGTAVCQRRSQLLSECHPLNSMARNATAYGNAPSIPTLKSENPDCRFRMVGSQKIIA